MPELPEVQTIVDDLNKKIVGHKIIDVWSDWPKTIKTPSFSQFKKLIKNQKILKIKRRAKNLLFYFSDNYMMLLHLKMTGHLLLGKWKIEDKKAIPISPKEIINDPYNKYIHIIFYLDKDKMIGFSDLRKFGKIIFGKKDKIENLPELLKLGPEPLEKRFKFNEFKEIISSEKRKIKQVLMDQEVIVGIGNIYADEVLWYSKINPLKPANKLSEKELKILFSAIFKILNKSLKLRGTSTSDYRDLSGKRGSYGDHLLAYKRENQPCFRCKIKIKRIKIGGRSTHFCPKCQKL
ncbi:bifunctional DNA-formamidopyrimidine glycosylase/DNA-(apurinic or apyrimidinic site) lyase [Candidatus Wolfebacteria bacterium]|nr:bifunctional DNA-formamidopyrimidine glycosylase/DNA-(apurinic or apyrimidinic site) lyase [Candidatus Wolfebacteria bacterium]